MSKLEMASFKLIGLKLNKKTTNAGGQSGIDCGNLWQEFENREITKLIPEKINDTIYAVYYDYDGDHTGTFSYFIGCRVKSDVETPDGLENLMIPGQKYDKITAEGKMPDCISNAWKSIWESKIKRSYGYDFEVYDERSIDWNKAAVDIFVSTE